MVLELTSLKSDVDRTILPLKLLGRILSHLSASLLVDSRPWPSLPVSLITPVSASFSTCMSLCLLIRTAVLGFRAHPTPVWLHHNNTSAKTLFPKLGHILRFQLGMNLSGTLFNPPPWAFRKQAHGKSRKPVREEQQAEVGPKKTLNTTLQTKSLSCGQRS